MATSAHVIDHRLVSILRARLEANPAVLSVAYRVEDRLLSVWIGIPEADHDTRKAIYAIEDELAARFPVPIEFHLITLEPGQDLRRYVATAAPLFTRAA